MEEEQLHAKIILQCRGFEEKHADMVTQAGGSPSWEDWAAECEQDDLVAFRDLITRGRQSRAIFEQCNLRLVAKIAYKYIDRGLELEVRDACHHQKYMASAAACIPRLGRHASCAVLSTASSQALAFCSRFLGLEFVECVSAACMY